MLTEEIQKLEEAYDQAVQARIQAARKEHEAWIALRDAYRKSDDLNPSLRTGSPV